MTARYDPIARARRATEIPEPDPDESGGNPASVVASGEAPTTMHWAFPMSPLQQPAALSDQPTCRAAKPYYVEERERRASWKGSAMEFNLADLFESVVDVVPEQPAIIADARRLTYAELDGRANRLAHHLASAGVGPGDRVGLQLANGSEYLEAMLACFKIRAVPVNVNYRYVTSELRYLYQDAGLVGLIFHSRFAPAVSDALAAMPERRTLLEVHDSTRASELGDRLRACLGGH